MLKRSLSTIDKVQPDADELIVKDDNLEQQHEDSSDEGSSAYDEEEYNDEDEEDDKLPEIIPDYASDSSDEETLNTVGNIPMEWYDEFDHIGYDIHGKKIIKPATGDEIDNFVNRMDDPNAWKSVFNELEGKNVVLSKAELDIIKRIQERRCPDASYDPYPNTVEWFTSKTAIHPVTNRPEPKSRFIPSKWEAQKIMKMVRVIRKGLDAASIAKKKAQKPKYYSIWDEEATSITENPMHIPAPKMRLPGNEESYNPPEEYLPDSDELKELQERRIEEKSLVIPTKHNSLRQVPGYERFVEERFERCLDLYLCPRMIKKKIQIDPESLVPKLPDPKELQPFPSTLSITYKGHAGKVRTISVDPTGQWLASGSDDQTVKVWEVSSGRMLKSWSFDAEVASVSWNPSKGVNLLSVSIENQLILLNPCVSAREISNQTDSLFGAVNNEIAQTFCKWRRPSPSEIKLGYRLILELKKTLVHMSWHRKGDYFASLTSESSGSAILIHQLSKMSTQNPFKKSNGLVQKVLFHPSKPLFYVATQRYVRVYNLMEQKLVKKLQSGVKWISSMDIHPQGDNVIIGSYDRRLCWFDTDLSLKPYRTLRYHKGGIRNVVFHKRYPLFASCSDDTTINIFHGMVYSDLMQNPLIVPLKSIKAHESDGALGAISCEFHPTQPWVFSSGADNLIKLFC